MAGFDRIDRISAEVARELDRILRDEVHDPRLGGTWSILRAPLRAGRGRERPGHAGR